MEENLRIIISGGGTGGHIFPAVSIANAIKEQHPEAEILFVGAEGRMEMQRVPAAGYPIKGLPVAGFDRKNLLKNVSVLFKLVKSQLLARKIIKDFKPHAAVGVGGYASGPTLKKYGSQYHCLICMRPSGQCLQENQGKPLCHYHVYRKSAQRHGKPVLVPPYGQKGPSG